MVNSKSNIFLRAVLSIVAMIFLVLFVSNLYDALLGNMEERLFSSNSELLVLRSKMIYVIYHSFLVVALLSLPFFCFVKPLKTKYLILIVILNVLLILLPAFHVA